jgi:hypothetical protein
MEGRYGQPFARTVRYCRELLLTSVLHRHTSSFSLLALMYVDYLGDCFYPGVLLILLKKKSLVLNLIFFSFSALVIHVVPYHLHCTIDTVF